MKFWLSKIFLGGQQSHIETLHRRLAKSPETCELLRQQASVFEWMNKNAADAEKDLPPVWFLNYMETYREEMAAEITTKVSCVAIFLLLRAQLFVGGSFTWDCDRQQVSTTS